MTRFVWATVTATGPLRIKIDGDSAALPYTPDSLVDPFSLTVNDRVRTEVDSNRIVVHDRSGGSGVPAANIGWTASSTAPTGWLICDGSTVSRTTYARLFAAIGVTYGAGDGSTTFGLPNLKGTVIAGRDSGQTEFATLGQSGGEKSHTLTVAEMPSHSHTLGPGQSFGVNYGANTGGSVTFQLHPDAENTNSFQGPYSAQNTGGDGAHNNLQPYVVLNPIIKT